MDQDAIDSEMKHHIGQDINKTHFLDRHHFWSLADRIYRTRRREEKGCDVTDGVREWDDWDLYERCVKDALHRFMPKDRFYRGHADVVKEMLALSTCRPHSLSRTLTLIHIHSHAHSLSYTLTLTHTHSYQHALSLSLAHSCLLPLSPSLAVSSYSLLLSLAPFFLDLTLLFLFHSRTPHTHTGPQWTMLSCEWCPLRLSLFFHR